MPFGLTNAPVTFQKLMNHTFRQVLIKFVLVYLYGIIIFSKSLDEHLKHFEVVLKLLENDSLRLNKTKYKFAVKNIEYLNYTVSEAGIAPNDDKVRS